MHFKQSEVSKMLLVFTNKIYSHLDRPNNYCRVLFVDFFSVFNIETSFTYPQNVKSKNKQIHNAVVLNFLTHRTQYVHAGKKKSKLITTNTGVPQGCVVSPVWFTIYTNDCQSSVNHVPILKSEDDSTLQCLILSGKELLLLLLLLLDKRLTGLYYGVTTTLYV